MEQRTRAMSEIGPTTYTAGQVIYPTDPEPAPVDAPVEADAPDQDEPETHKAKAKAGKKK